MAWGRGTSQSREAGAYACGGLGGVARLRPPTGCLQKVAQNVQGGTISKERHSAPRVAGTARGR